ncbi:copper amine oxidase N-terminal domain-containing protein [Acidaminobacter sp. JC074]|uniref:copper amine oxidase N-terminal domain-containing protein n=1 Tax=Acidaminobacter sp. JC074 TaxID=2530199 RepID=UPI001F0EB286|nr:copper amine oxidase N-terminal domain-containing protein [Acidaminobacter sp. JC074]MCH4890975.1 copper amine oxidase N-terminal domain-containing protein [Acidaminobacter sp. JC074]
MKTARISIGIIVLIILLFGSSVFAVDVTINGDTLISEDKPYISDTNRTMVPVRAISEALGLDVVWHESTRQVEIKGKDKVIWYTLDSNQVTVDDVAYSLDSPPVIKDNRTYLPLSDLAGHLEIGVHWDNESKTAELTQTVIGMNLSHIHYWSSQWTFKDVMKQSAVWWVQPEDLSKWSVNKEIPLRPDGYPLEIPYDGHVVHTVMLMHMDANGPMYPKGDYTLRFEGKGRIFISMDETDLVFSQADTDHLIPVTPSYNGIHLTILESDKNDPIRNIQVMMPGFKTDDTQPFHPSFIDLVKDFKLLRFMKTSYVEETPSFDWHNRTLPRSQTQSNMATGGMSFEYITDLSNMIKADPWINVPHDASDDYVRKLAEFYKENLDQNLRLYIEYSNEPWNPMFIVYNDNMKKGEALGLGSGEEALSKYNVRRSLEMMAIFKDVYGSDYKERVTWSISTWGARKEIGDYILDEMDKSGYPDAFTVAPYFGGELANDVGDGIVYTDDQVFDLMKEELETTIKDQIILYKNQADQRGMRLLTYEAGSHFVSLFYPEDQILVEQMKRINSDERIKDMYKLYYDIWHTYAKDITTLFVFCEEPNIYGDFGMIHHFDDLDHPKWQVLKELTK